MLSDQGHDAVATRLAGWRPAVVWVALTLLATAWTPWFVDFDEAVYAEVARGMWQSGSWLAPTWNGAPFLEKPLLFFWAVGGLYQLLGLTPLAPRLISVVAAVLLLSSLGRILERRTTAAVAETTVWVAGASLLPFSLGRLGLLDATLTTAVTVALLTFYFGLSTPTARDRRRWLAVGYLASGLAMAVKGPVFPLLIGAVLLGDAVRRRAVPTTLRRSGLLWGAPLILLAGLPSNLPVLLLGDGSGGFLVEHNVVRALAPMQGHSGGPWYYLPVMLVALLPFSALVPGAIGSLRDQSDANAQLARFCLVWAATVTVAFSIAGTKLPHYIAPALPPLAILVGLEAGRAGRRRRGRWVATLALTGLFGVLLAALPWVIASAPSLFDARTLAKVPEIPFVPHGATSRTMMGGLGLGVLLAAVYAARAAARGEQQRAVRRLGVAACLLWSALWLAAGHAASVAWQDPLRRLASAADAALPPDDPIVLVEMNHRVTPTLETGRRVVFLRAGRAEQVENLRSLLGRNAEARVVMPAPTWSELQPRVGGREVLRDGPYALIAQNAPRPEGEITPPGR